MEAAGDIRTTRLALRIAQKELADRADVPLATLRRIERGFREPSEAELARMAMALGVDPGSLGRAHARTVATPGEGYTTVRADGTEVTDRRLTPPAERVHVLDLFCGAGGLSHGFEQTGAFAVTAGLDLLRDRIGTFRLNHPYAATILGDVRTFPRDALRSLAMDPDVVVGGPPCQGFSSIRPFRTLTEGDPRNSLVEEFVLIVGELRPRWFVFENVVGLLTHDKGTAFRALLRGFADAGYSVDWRVVNMALLGLPQARERLVVVGSRDGEAFDWPAPTHAYDGRSMAGKEARRLHVEPLFHGRLPPAVTVMDAIGDLPPVENGAAATAYDDSRPMTDYARMVRGDCRELTMHESTRHSEKMMEIVRLAGANRSALPEGLTTSGFSSCYSRLEADRPSVTLTVNFTHPASNRCIHPFQDRALTPREGARLQGFPDAFQFAGTRAQVVKQLGNAVPPVLGKAIAECLARALGLGDHASAPRTHAGSEDLPGSGRVSSRRAATG